MPLYEYRCDDCNEVYDDVRPVAKRDDPVEHSGCDGTLSRVFNSPGISIEGRAYVYRGDPNRMFD